MEDNIFSIKVLKMSGERDGSFIDLSKFNNLEIDYNLIYLYVNYYRNNQRQGTHKAKEKGDVRGSTKKLIKQKGVGGARRGSIKSPLLRGGGRVFGPKPNDYDTKMNKKEKKKVLFISLKCMILKKSVCVVDVFDISSCKTKDFVNCVMKNIGIDLLKKNLIVTDSYNDNLYLASRNIKNVYVKTLATLNAYDIFNSAKVFFDKKSINNLCSKLN